MTTQVLTQTQTSAKIREAIEDLVKTLDILRKLSQYIDKLGDRWSRWKELAIAEELAWVKLEDELSEIIGRKVYVTSEDRDVEPGGEGYWETYTIVDEDRNVYAIFGLYFTDRSCKLRYVEPYIE